MLGISNSWSGQTLLQMCLLLIEYKDAYYSLIIDDTATAWPLCPVMNMWHLAISYIVSTQHLPCWYHGSVATTRDKETYIHYLVLVHNFAIKRPSDWNHIITPQIISFDEFFITWWISLVGLSLEYLVLLNNLIVRPSYFPSLFLVGYEETHYHLQLMNSMQQMTLSGWRNFFWCAVISPAFLSFPSTQTPPSAGERTSSSVDT